jgi:hypothetical protein
MSLLADVTKELLDASDWGLPRKIRRIIRGILFATLCLAPGAFILGAVAVANERACTVESVVAPLIVIPGQVPLRVAEQNGECTITEAPQVKGGVFR